VKTWLSSKGSTWARSYSGTCKRGCPPPQTPARPPPPPDMSASVARAQGIQSWDCHLFLLICCSLSAVCAEEQALWYPVGTLSAQPCFWKQLTYLPNWCWVVFFFFWWFFFSPLALQIYLSVIKTNGKHFSFSHICQNFKIYFHDISHRILFYVPLKGHRILMSLAFMILICRVLLPSYNKLTKGKEGTRDIKSCGQRGREEN